MLAKYIQKHFRPFKPRKLYVSEDAYDCVNVCITKCFLWSKVKEFVNNKIVKTTSELEINFASNKLNLVKYTLDFIIRWIHLEKNYCYISKWNDFSCSISMCLMLYSVLYSLSICLHHCQGRNHQMTRYTMIAKFVSHCFDSSQLLVSIRLQYFNIYFYHDADYVFTQG